NPKTVRPQSFQPQKDRKPEAAAKGQETSAQVDENVGARGPRNIQQPKIDRRSGQPRKGDKPEAVAADQNWRVQPEGANQENGREQRGLQAGQQDTNRFRTEREAGVKDMAADKDKNQQIARQGADQRGRLSGKTNGQPIHDDVTQDLRNVAVKTQENSVQQPK